VQGKSSRRWEGVCTGTEGRNKTGQMIIVRREKKDDETALPNHFCDLTKESPCVYTDSVPILFPISPDWLSVLK
jgi:hypothetical protein